MTAYSEDALVLVRFPLPGQDSDRETWPWLPGIITAVCPMGPQPGLLTPWPAILLARNPWAGGGSGSRGR